MTADKNVTIIIPTKNRASMIDKLLENAKKVNFSQLIVVENNSKQSEIEIYKKACSAHSVEFYSISGDVSAGDARNFGLSKSKCEYTFFLDDDDLLTQEFIDFLNKNSSNLSDDVYRFTLKYDNGDQSIPGKGEQLTKKYMFYSMQPSSYLCRTSFLRKFNIKFAEKVVHQDTHFSEMIWSSGAKQIILNINSIIYNTKTISITRSKKMIANELASIREFDNKKYKNGEIYKFKLILYVMKLAKKYPFDVSKKQAKYIIYKEFRLLKNKFSIYRKLPNDMKFIFVLWSIKVLFARFLKIFV